MTKSNERLSVVVAGVLGMVCAWTDVEASEVRWLDAMDDLSDVNSVQGLMASEAHEVTLMTVKGDSEATTNKVIIRVAPDASGKEQIVSVRVNDGVTPETVITVPELPVGKTISVRPSPVGEKQVVHLSAPDFNALSGGEVTLRLLRQGGLFSDDKRNFTMRIVNTPQGWESTLDDGTRFDGLFFRTNDRGIIGVDVQQGGQTVRSIDTDSLPK